MSRLFFAALHHACYSGSMEVVSLLLSRQAQVGVANRDGFTPLHWAVVNQHEDCIRLLIQHGAR
jgi:ankyrin repeat protein